MARHRQQSVVKDKFFHALGESDETSLQGPFNSVQEAKNHADGWYSDGHQDYIYVVKLVSIGGPKSKIQWEDVK